MNSTSPKRILKNCIHFGFYLLVRTRWISHLLWKIGDMAQHTHTLFKNNSQPTPEQNPNRSPSPISVTQGFFKGLSYPRRFSHGSVFEGKIFGIYESELTPFIERLTTQKQYQQLIDIGAAEGFYAVGLAIKNPNLEVHAFDIAPGARALLGELAAYNNVADQVRICGYCTPQTFSALPWADKTLIISDCEGYETTLFTQETIPFLQHSDLIIELHTTPGLEVQQQLTDLFEATHTIQFVDTLTPIEKFQQLENDLPKNLTSQQLYEILNEKRTRSFGWLILETKSNA